MKRRIIYFLIMVFAVFVIVGCGKRYDITKLQFKTPVEGSGKVAILVQDQRPFVINEQKTPTFIGLHRTGYGIPYNATTTSRGTVADDIAAILTASLRENGFQAKPYGVAMKIIWIRQSRDLPHWSMIEFLCLPWINFDLIAGL